MRWKPITRKFTELCLLVTGGMWEAVKGKNSF